jgi:hypothetical protein
MNVIARRRWSSKPSDLRGCIETKPTKQSPATRRVFL